MKITSMVFTIALLLGTLFLAVEAAYAQEKRVAPPRPEDLIGVWIGFWEDEEFTRLDLRADSTGYCAYVAPPDFITHQSGVHVYRITRWSVDRWKLNVSLAPVDSRRDESIYLRGRAGYLWLQLEIGGTSRKWKQQVVLHKESRIQASNLETKSKIEEAERK